MTEVEQRNTTVVQQPSRRPSWGEWAAIASLVVIVFTAVAGYVRSDSRDASTADAQRTETFERKAGDELLHKRVDRTNERLDAATAVQREQGERLARVEARVEAGGGAR